MRHGFFALALLALGSTGLSGCSKIASRDLVREGNSLYEEGKYIEAIAKFDEAQKHEPDAVTLLWNRACAAESIVLPLKEATDANKIKRRTRYADIALADFQAWFNASDIRTEQERKAAEEHRLVVLLADHRCDDLIAHWQEKLKAEPKAEGLYSVIARTYKDTCNKRDKAMEWYKKRTEDFPTSAKGWHTYAVRTFEQLMPEPDSGIFYNADLLPDQRIAIANEAIGYLDKATEYDPKYRDPYIFRSMSYSQRQLARVFNDPPKTPDERLAAILSREDSMLGWKQRRAVCDIDQTPDCPVEAKAKAVIKKPANYAGKLLAIKSKILLGSIEHVGTPAEPVVEVILESGLKVRQTYLAKVSGVTRTGEQLAQLVEGAEKAWVAGDVDVFVGKLNADGTVLETEARPPGMCCPPPPLTSQEVAADQSSKRQLEAEIERNSKRKQRRRGRRGRRRGG